LSVRKNFAGELCAKFFGAAEADRLRCQISDQKIMNLLLIPANAIMFSGGVAVFFQHLGILVYTCAHHET